MASTVSVQKSASRLAVRNYIDDPANATVARAIAWVDMSGYEYFLALATLYSGTGVLTFRILASENADGSGSPVEVKVHATPTTADAAGDTLVLELSAAELPMLGDGLRYVSVEMDNDHQDDINVITYVRSGARYGGDLTADVIAP